ncbi:hypothetical protein ELUMI_v1c04110 [Williamsoniiplasma luminosum]|uniref:Uncharacterized protein n=1 Tax=Williamsoniiplasma luminosum TaxID=214888 RepID=A0A2K8NTF9_9MOLU|nr:hypothetical protein [Williamsoniiplasma luminosum]ATZ17135.1 hypothetical protein ELUMI_v1c04110 [Williamsoniiplasma luminosum]
MNVFNKEINNLNENIIKQQFLAAISMKNETFFINQDQLQNINNIRIINVLKDVRINEVLNNLYQNKTLVFENNQARFNLIKPSVLKATPGFSREDHWYWFGYTKWFFDDILTKNIAHTITGSTYNTITVDLEKLVPELGSWVSSKLGFTIMTNGGSKYLKSVDAGNNGIWFSTFWGVQYGPWGQ